MEVPGKILTRKGMVEKEKAMSTARNIKDSKFGNALLKNNFQQNRLLVTTLGRLDNQLKRQQMHIDQQKKRFLNRRRPEPSIIVERPASPEKFAYDSDSDASSENDGLPGYMKPLKTRVKTPSNLPTIDAFVLKTKKKANVWEEAMDRNERPQFQSTVLPSAVLTEEEKMDLHAGWLYHRPPSRGSARTPTPTQKSITSAVTLRDIKSAIRRTDPSVAFSDDSSEVSGTTFITQMNHFRYNTEHLGNKRTAKSVKFSTDISVIQDKTPQRRLNPTLDNVAKAEQYHRDDGEAQHGASCSRKVHNNLALLRELTKDSPRDVPVTRRQHKKDGYRRTVTSIV